MTHASVSDLEDIANDPRRLLADHHDATEHACMALLARTYTDDPQELIAHFRLFEHAVRDHLAAEEELILPAYAEHAPADAQALRDDHVAIRKALEGLAIDVELHCVRAHSINALINSLRAHARRENAGMYPWAQAHLAATPRKQLLLRVGRSLRTLAQFRRRHA